jgi:glutamyl-tRNA synthetase
MTIRRPDGSWIFHFVSVVDDIEMEITHVIRGEDHLSNTPKHLELYQALGARPPRFAHIPLILNKDGSKMSKRDQGGSLVSYIDGGYVPEAVRNYLCLLGWSPKDDREKLDWAEIIRLFDLDKINRKNASFDLEKCTWLNGEYVRELPDDRFHALARESLSRAGVNLAPFADDYVRAALDTCKGKVRTFAELPVYCGFYFRDEVTYAAEGVAKHFTAEHKPRLMAVRDAFAASPTFDAASLEAVLRNTASALGVKASALVHPARLAVTGSNAGPSLYHLLEILGRDQVLARINAALATF